MTPRNDLVSLEHMLEHAREAVMFGTGKTVEEIESDRLLALALVRLMEIVGESAHRVSEPTRRSHPEIPWNPVIGLRNRLIHGYDAIDYRILWQVINTDLPILIADLEAIVASDNTS